MCNEAAFSCRPQPPVASAASLPRFDYCGNHSAELQTKIWNIETHRRCNQPAVAQAKGENNLGSPLSPWYAAVGRNTPPSTPSTSTTRCSCLRHAVALQVHDLIRELPVGLFEGAHLGHHLLVLPLRGDKYGPQTMQLFHVCGRQLSRRRARSRSNGRNRARRRRDRRCLLQSLLQLRDSCVQLLRPSLQPLDISRISRIFRIFRIFRISRSEGTTASDRLCVAHERRATFPVSGRRNKRFRFTELCL